MINCVKMNGNGNDFIVIDNMPRTLDSDELAKIARTACRRREAVGADGILVAEPSERADFKMRLFNCDGSEGEMCGNGARCIARFALEKGIVNDADMTFETLGGIIHASVNGRRATIDLAPVSLSNAVINAHASVGGYDFDYTFLNVGVPHTVIFESERTRDIADCALLGREIRNRLDLFPEGTNVNFAIRSAAHADTLDVVTYERGVEDVTLSCGTGSVASAITAMTLGFTGSKVDVINPGGINRVFLERCGDDTILPRLEGKTSMTAELTLLPDALSE